MTGDNVQRRVIEVSEDVRRRIGDLAPLASQAITRNVRVYRETAAVPYDVVASTCADHMHQVLTAISQNAEFVTDTAAKVGTARARAGVPLPSLMEAYQVLFRHLWKAVVTEAARHPNVGGDALEVLSTKVCTAQEVFTSVMADAYREAQIHMLRDDESLHTQLIDSLLFCRAATQWSTWEAADYLGLPFAGPFVVVAADAGGTEAGELPDLEPMLRSHDVPSAWRRLPELRVGIVHIKTDAQYNHLLALLSRNALGRIGVSARYQDLRDTAQALRFARTMLRGRVDPSRTVAVFDGSILASAAVAAPELMASLAAPILEGFAKLSDEERDVLLDTFRAWVNSDGSMRAVGEVMFCHPNTVRYRLHRIERCTGRSLTKPRDIAELSLAFEAHRRLM